MRAPLPKYGIYVPVRVCDGCYHDLGGVLHGKELTRSYGVSNCIPYLGHINAALRPHLSSNSLIDG